MENLHLSWWETVLIVCDKHILSCERLLRKLSSKTRQRWLLEVTKHISKIYEEVEYGWLVDARNENERDTEAQRFAYFLWPQIIATKALRVLIKVIIGFFSTKGATCNLIVFYVHKICKEICFASKLRSRIWLCILWTWLVTALCYGGDKKRTGCTEQLCFRNTTELCENIGNFLIVAALIRTIGRLEYGLRKNEALLCLQLNVGSRSVRNQSYLWVLAHIMKISEHDRMSDNE